MRILIAAAVAAMALAGCSVETSVKEAVGEMAAEEGQGWTMEVVGDDGAERMVLVTGPDGQQSAALIAGADSRIATVAEVQTLMAQTQTALAAGETPPERVAITAPGVSIKVAGDDEVEGGRGKVSIDAGGVSIRVDGDSGAGDGRGAFRIAGVNDKAAAKFIEGLDELSPEVKAQMRSSLGLKAE